MAKSKIIKDLVTENITLAQALDRLLIIAMELEDESLLKWIRQEKNGYEENDSLPNYRKVQLTPIGNFQIYSMGTIATHKKKVLPTMGVSTTIKDTMNNYWVRDSIAGMVESIASIDKGGTAGIPIPPELFYMFEKDTNIHLTSATLSLDKTSLVRIIDATKTRMIEILTMLEKNFGCLDELDIDVRDYDTNEISKLREELMKIIDGKPSGTTYIITKSKIKNSNVGEGNTVDKNSTVELNPSISVQHQEKKKTFWQRIKEHFSH